MPTEKQKSAPACWCSKSHSPQKNSWLALRAAREKTAPEGGNFRSFPKMVHLCDLSWNQIVPSLRLMQSKLIDLGFEYYNGKIVINEIETEGSNYHAK